MGHLGAFQAELAQTNKFSYKADQLKQAKIAAFLRRETHRHDSSREETEETGSVVRWKRRTQQGSQKLESLVRAQSAPALEGHMANQHAALMDAISTQSACLQMCEDMPGEHAIGLSRQQPSPQHAIPACCLRNRSTRTI